MAQVVDIGNILLHVATWCATNGVVPNELMSTTEVAATLRVSEETVKRWARDGKVPAVKNLTGKWLFDPDDIEALPVERPYDPPPSVEPAVEAFEDTAQ